jgi:hypothetical protein
LCRSSQLPCRPERQGERRAYKVATTLVKRHQQTQTDTNEDGENQENNVESALLSRTAADSIAGIGFDECMQSVV